MEINAYDSYEQSSLINELTQGMELAKRLRAQMGPEHSVETKEIIVRQLVSSYDKALFILGSGEAPVPSPVMPSSPASTMGSPKNDDLHATLNSHRDGKESSRKRKAESTWTMQVKVNSDTSVDGPPADGYSWRKYGQKDILGAKHPRSYYRCTHRNVHNCWATKQVQRSDDDPTTLHITYKGKHTCTMARQSKSAPTSPAKQEPKPDNLPTMEHQQDSSMVLSFQDAISANTQNVDCYPVSWTAPTTFNNINSFCGGFPSSVISPSTSGSNHFSMSPCSMDTFGSVQHHHNLETDIAEILSAANSPTIEPGFSFDAWSFGPTFPFNSL